MTRRRRLLAASLFAALCAEMLVTPAEALPSDPTLRLIDMGGEPQTITRGRRSKPVRFDMNAMIASVNGAFELRATRDTNYGPISLRQVDDHDPNTTVRPMVAETMMDGWGGLKDFFELTVANANFEFTNTYGWCPNDGARSRTSDVGPATPHYPNGCPDHPFMLGTVWGIEAGWATDAFFGEFLSVPDGTYDVTLKIANDYQTLFEIDQDDAEVETSFTVKTKKRRRRRATSSRAVSAAPVEEASHTAPPDDDTPDPAWLPDLRALPAYAVDLTTRNGRNYVEFAATEWNAGPQPMVIEGFRQNTTVPTMEAYQYFYENGAPVARDEAGLLEYETHDDHDHWHFQQFVTYDLIEDHNDDEAAAPVATSGKQAWCLVPNAAVDLTVPGAEWQPGNTDLATACGHTKSLWIREVVDVGHGDTYFQFSGEALDVTDLPPGNYQIRINVNPVNAFHEADTSNNYSFRNIVLSGSGADQTVDVLPYKGVIDD